MGEEKYEIVEEVKGCRPAKAFIGEEQLSKCDSEALSNTRRGILGKGFIEKTCFKSEEIRKLLQFWRKMID